MAIILRESEWSSEACNKFAELVHLAQWKSLIAKVKGYKERPISYGKSRREDSSIPCIDLYDKDGDKVRKEINAFLQKF